MKNNLQDWTCEDVVQWIKVEVGLKNYDYEIVRAHEIDGRDLIDLTEDNLKYDLKIIKLHERKVFLRKICELIRRIVETNVECPENMKDSNRATNSNLAHRDCDNNKKGDQVLNESSKLNQRQGYIPNVHYYNLHYKDSSICETATKNRYLSFEALDNFEKNGYTFSVKKNLTNSLDNASDKDKVTINSYYNISNLNNYNQNHINEKSLNSFKSPFSSYDNKSSNYLNTVNPQVTKSNKKKAKLSCLNIRSKKKMDFDQLSNNNEVNDDYMQSYNNKRDTISNINQNQSLNSYKNFNSVQINPSMTGTSFNNFMRIEGDNSLYQENEKKIDIDLYMSKLISYKNSRSSQNNNQNQSCNSEKSRKLYDKKNAKKIKAKKNVINGESMSSLIETQNENEIENFLKSMKSKIKFINNII